MGGGMISSSPENRIRSACRFRSTAQRLSEIAGRIGNQRALHVITGGQFSSRSIERGRRMQSLPSRGLSDRSLVALAVLNFFLADAGDGLGPFLGGFLATKGWSPMTLRFIATLGGVLGMIAPILFGAWVDASRHKRMLIIVPTSRTLRGCSCGAGRWRSLSSPNC